MCYLYIYGASGHSKVVLEIAESLRHSIGGLVDDNPNITKMLDYAVNGDFHFTEEDVWVLGIGNNRIRKAIVEKRDCLYVSLVHPNATVSQRVKIAKGTVVMAGATINSEAQIGQHCIINTNASIDHDCVIEDYVHISPNSSLAGNVLIGEGTHVGIGACVIQGIKVGRWCTVGAGAVVIRDVPDGVTVVGNLARIIKQKEL